MRRFYVEPDRIQDARIIISGDESRHIANVLRLRPGERVVVFDGSGYDYQVELSSVTGAEVQGEVLSRSLTAAESPVAITLVQGLVKGEKMDFIIQKAVELGVSRIIPLQSDHSVVKLEGERALSRVQRWNRVAVEACKQCGRSRPAAVEEVSRLAPVLARFDQAPRVFFYEGRKQDRLGVLIAERRRAMSERGTVIIIGPEGGFSEAEARMAEDAGAFMAGLGPRTLRTETAGLVALSIFMWELGDLGRWDGTDE